MHRPDGRIESALIGLLELGGAGAGGFLIAYIAPYRCTLRMRCRDLSCLSTSGLAARHGMDILAGHELRGLQWLFGVFAYAQLISRRHRSGRSHASDS
jgi:hypothetical protein